MRRPVPLPADWPSGRRSFLKLLAIAPAALAASGAAAQAVCGSLESLPPSQRTTRKAMNYMTVSDDPKRQCRGCSFYSAPQNDCGHCSLFNGPAPAGGRCDSWAARS